MMKTQPSFLLFRPRRARCRALFLSLVYDTLSQKMNVVKQTLKNGLRVIAIPKAESIATNILVLVEAGSKYETKEINGLSHFLEHMCFKGTKSRPKPLQVAMELDALGAQYNAFTSQEYTGYYATVQPKFFARAFDLVADLYLNPLFPEAEIEKEKGVVVEEINMYEDLPMRQVHDVFGELLYGDQPAGWNVLGTKETVRALRRSDFLTYRERYYVPGKTIVVVSGNFAEKELAKELNRFFAGLKEGPKAEKPAVIECQERPAVLVKRKQSDQTHLVLGVRAYPHNHPEHFTAEVLAQVLGGGMSSRLSRRIREEMGAAYYVRTENDSSTDHGSFTTSVGADTSRAREVVAVILEEHRRLLDEAVPADELQRIKDSLIGNLHLGLETTSSLAVFYGMQEILAGKLLSPEEVAQKVLVVTPEQIKKVANELFVNKHLNLAMIGPVAGEEFVAELSL